MQVGATQDEWTIPLEIDELCSLIAEVLSVQVQRDGSQIRVKRADYDLDASFDVSGIKDVLLKIDGARLVDSRLSTEVSAEFLVKYSGAPRPFRREDLVLKDEADGLTYCLGQPSLGFALLAARSLVEASRDSGRSLRFAIMPYRGHMAAGDGEVDVLGLFVSALRLTTLRIESKTRTSVSTFQSLADSFYFHVGYNLDYPIVPQIRIDERLRRVRIQRIRRAGAGSIDAPHRKYIPDLVHNYQLAVSAESPMLAFLSFYHVAEHWFEEIFQNELALKLQAEITSPGFSYRRMKDLRRLIKTVSSELKVRDDEIVINELNALRLTLERYVDLPNLCDSLNAFDADLLTHYASGPVSFSGGNSVDLASDSPEQVLKALAQRIYKNRNALVHRKNGARSRFYPFRDDADLEPEVPLMRFVAEQIIIGSSSV